MYRKFVFWLKKSLNRKWQCNGFCVTCPYVKRCEYEFKGRGR